MTHEFDGKKYEKSSAHQKEWGSKLISELDLKGNERVLDLGCGDGANTAILAELLPNGEVVGIDASRGMIEAASPKEKANLRFLLMDIDEIKFKNEFDLIFSNATLHWVKDHRHLLTNVYQALCRGGILRFNFAADGNCSSFLKIIRKAMKRQEFNSHFKDFIWPWYMPSIDEYKQLIKRNELQEARVWGENADHFFPDIDALIGWVDQPCLVPFLARVADPQKIHFRNYVVNEMIQETKQADGRCFETFRRINLYAKKSATTSRAGATSAGDC